MPVGSLAFFVCFLLGGVTSIHGQQRAGKADLKFSSWGNMVNLKGGEEHESENRKRKTTIEGESEK